MKRQIAEKEARIFGVEDPGPFRRNVRRAFLERFLQEFISQAGLIKKGVRS